ncbi:glycosyltransferase family 2 protein [Flavobacterium soyangense]|uniref:Glycosyltransferase family 2 protein n=1 Tax=Flavobacterium soyangense TaxID=2023265 RepID=A0A930UCT6_9FLAO|nr:glycosyltransferase family 2 protein [Flavobacterium soyangense]MBF2708389.1 glycosyltransferase family 2 protein [Flavobacterium soyangense]
MISILIPIYNYDAFPLVSELHKQCLESRIEFEILCQDDTSNQFLNENQKINNLENCNFSRNNSNLGRGKNINFLAEKAKFEWLLIMDCDTFPIHNIYIQKYISQINEGEKVIYGGIEYKKEKPNNDQLLRWFYGNARESLSVEKRNTNPNGNTLTSNILIKKNTFISNKFDESITKYGYEDLVFLSELKKKKVLVKHIDNPTYHLGLETSKQFLEKTKTALENLELIIKTNTLDNSESKILRIYSFLKRLYLVSIISFLFKKTEGKIEQNLLSQNPSLLLFDFYKLGYFCNIKTQ